MDTETDQGNPTDHLSSHRLFTGGVGALVVAIGYFVWAAGGAVDLPEIIGFSILILASLPILLWAKNRRTWFPAFEISMLACVAFYALPLLNRKDELLDYPPNVITQGAFLALIYVITANLGFFIVRNPVRASGWATSSLLPESSFRYLPVGVLLNTIYIYTSSFTTVIPYNLDGSLRALFLGVGTISLFVLARLWGLGQLDRKVITFVVINIFAQLVFLFSTLYLIGGISMLALTLISYASAKRKIPWLIIAIVFPVIALLHIGKSDMRAIYWEPNATPITISDLPAYYEEWFDRSLSAREDHRRNPTDSISIFQRASLIQMLCLSVDQVPTPKPYLYGESYLDIPAQIIPRFFWPDKPSSLLSNIRLALYFNLVSTESAFKVSIAFGMIAEAYINFGVLGVALLGLFLGMGFKRISMLSEQAAQFSALGIFMILLTAWSFQVEQVMATWLSSLFQACVISIGIPVVWKKFFGAA
ncbi:MAG TPA: hypothetical protein VL357_06245 [Rariglobus sp.]|nr:hypothetical protein [Rariglobus sp.]